MPLQVCLSCNPSTTLVGRAVFFKYLSLKGPGDDAKSFGLFQLKADGMDEKLLAQIQLSVFNVWVDKLRSTAADVTITVLKNLPAHLDYPDVLRHMSCWGLSGLALGVGMDRDWSCLPCSQGLLDNLQTVCDGKISTTTSILNIGVSICFGRANSDYFKIITMTLTTD